MQLAILQPCSIDMQHTTWELSLNTRELKPRMPAPFGTRVHHARRSSGASSSAGGHAPPASTASTSLIVRGHTERFSRLSSRTKTSSEVRGEPMPQGVGFRLLWLRLLWLRLVLVVVVLVVVVVVVVGHH